MSDIELGYLVALNGVPDLGPASLSSLLATCGPASEVWRHSESDLIRKASISPPQARSIVAARPTVSPEAELARLARAGIEVVTQGQAAYPAALLDMRRPPILLFVLGDPDSLQGRCVALVGSRRCSPQGLIMARSLGAGLSEAGVTVVSGMARGIDSAAHEGALLGPSPTVAVLGCGVDVGENAALHRRIAERGAVVSEYNPGTPPGKWRFPARNRIISGLSETTVLVEAGRRSGALITADLALDQCREVMAVPGSPLNAFATGSNQLIADGAGLVQSVDDILSGISGRSERAGRSTPHSRRLVEGVTPAERLVVASLRCGPMGISDLVLDTGLEPSAVAEGLASLVTDAKVLATACDMFVLNFGE